MIASGGASVRRNREEVAGKSAGCRAQAGRAALPELGQKDPGQGQRAADQVMDGQALAEHQGGDAGGDDRSCMAGSFRLHFFSSTLYTA